MWKISLKIIISGLMLWLLFREVQLHELRPYFQQGYFNFFAIALLVQLISSLIAAWRWSLIMDTLGFQASRNFYLKSYLKGVMFNQILPTSIGGDAYRMLEASRLGRGKKEALLGVLVDRVYGFIGLVVISLLSLPFAYYLLPRNVLGAIVAVSMVAILSVIVLMQLRSVSVPFLTSILGIFRDLGQCIKKSVVSWQDFSLKSILTLLPNFLTVCAFFLLAHALGLAGNLLDYLLIIPAVLLLTMIPISLAGWGVREGAMVFMGALIGINKPEALAISLLFGLVLILTSLPGLYFYLTKKTLGGNQ